MKNKYALLSVFDKTGIAEIAESLINIGYQIIATEGTGNELLKSGITCISANNMTSNLKILTDCIQTISFNLEGGIIFDRNNPVHLKVVDEYSIPIIDYVVCNFADISKTVTSDSDFNIKNVDLGGPLMIRAAAINFMYVLPIVEPADYHEISILLSKSPEINLSDRKRYAIKAFEKTSSYDKLLASYLISQ